MEPDPQTAEQSFSIAQSYFKEQNWQESAHFLRLALRTNPEHLRARLLLGEVLLRMGELDEGLQVVEPAYQASPKTARGILVRLLVARAKQYDQEHKEDLALELVDRAYLLAPEDGEVYKLRVQIWRRRGDRALVRDELETAAQAYREAGDLDRASHLEKLYRWQIESDLESRARSLEYDGRWQEAADLYERLLSIAVDMEVKQSWRDAAIRCREEDELATIYLEGMKAMERRDWTFARTAFLRLVTRRVDYARGGKWATELLDQATKAAAARLYSDYPTKTPVRLSPVVISLENARRLIRVSRLGTGQAGTLVYSPLGDRLAISASTGVFIYHPMSLTRSRFIDADDWVRCLAISPNGEILATGFLDGTIWLWRMLDGALLHKLRGHTRPVRALGFSADGSLLVSGGEDGSIRIWTTQDGKFLRMSGNLLDAIVGLQVNPVKNQVAYITGDGSLWLQSFPEGDSPRQVAGSQAGVQAIAFSRDGERLFASGNSPEIFCWSSSSPAFPETIQVPASEAIMGLQVNLENTLLAAGCSSGRVMIFDMETWNLHAALENSIEGLKAFTFVEGDYSLATTGWDNQVRLWKLTSIPEFHLLEEFNSAIYQSGFLGGGNHLLTAQADGTVELWNLVDKTRRKNFVKQGGAIVALATTPDGEFFAAGGEDRVTRVYQSSSGKIQRSITGLLPVKSLAFSPNGALMAIGYQNGRLIIRKWVDDHEVAGFSAHRGEITQVLFSPGGMLLASAGKDGSIRISLASTGARIHALEGVAQEVTSLAFSPGGAELFAGTSDGFLWQWDSSASWRLVRSYKAHPQAVTALVVSADGKLIVTGSADGKLAVWQVDKENLLLVIQAHGDRVTDLRFSPDGTLLASSSLDGTVRLWGVIG